MTYEREITEINRFILLTAPFVGRQRYYAYTEAVNTLLHNTNITYDEMHTEYSKLREQLKNDEKLTSQIIKDQLLMSLDHIMCYSEVV